jgi:hypothetical protein
MRVCRKLDLYTSASRHLEAAFAFPRLSIVISNEDGMIRHPHGNTRLILLLKAPVTFPLISRSCQIGMVRNFNLDARQFGSAIAPFTGPTAQSGGFRQKRVLWNFDQITAHITLSVSRQAFPAVAEIRIEIGIRWNLDRDTLVAFLNKAIMAIPSLAIGGVHPKRVVRQLYLETRVILLSKATLAFPAGAISTCLCIFWQRLPGLANRPRAECRRKHEHVYRQVERLTKLSMHELVSSKVEPAISEPKAGNVRIAERSKFLLPEDSEAFLFQETLGKFIIHLCATNVFYLSRLLPGRPVLGALQPAV